MNHPEYHQNRNDRRKLFIRELVEELIRPWVEKRSKNVNGLRKDTIQCIEQILGKKITNQSKIVELQENNRNRVSQRCHKCLSEAMEKHSVKKLSKATMNCVICNEIICGKHCSNVKRCYPGSFGAETNESDFE